MTNYCPDCKTELLQETDKYDTGIVFSRYVCVDCWSNYSVCEHCGDAIYPNDKRIDTKIGIVHDECKQYVA